MAKHCIIKLPNQGLIPMCRGINWGNNLSTSIHMIFPSEAHGHFMRIVTSRSHRPTHDRWPCRRPAYWGPKPPPGEPQQDPNGKKLTFYRSFAWGRHKSNNQQKYSVVQCEASDFVHLCSDLVTSGHPSVEICLPVMEHHLYSWYTLQSFNLAKENPPCTCRVGQILPVLHPLDISLLWLTIHNFWLILPCLRLKPI